MLLKVIFKSKITEIPQIHAETYFLTVQVKKSDQKHIKIKIFDFQFCGILASRVWVCGLVTSSRFFGRFVFLPSFGRIGGRVLKHW